LELGKTLLVESSLEIFCCQRTVGGLEGHSTWMFEVPTIQEYRCPSIHQVIQLLDLAFPADISSPPAHIDTLSLLADSASAALEEQTQ
jgi:hypothetical protein